MALKTITTRIGTTILTTQVEVPDAPKATKRGTKRTSKKAAPEPVPAEEPETCAAPNSWDPNQRFGE